MNLHLRSLALSCTLLSAATSLAQLKPITLDEYLNTTEIDDARISPDGSAAAIATTSPDWKANRNNKDIWLWKRGGTTSPITHTGNNSEPKWSPDGHFLAFMSDRPLPGEAPAPDSREDSAPGKTDRIWLLPAAGGEAFPLYREPLDTHAFAWSPDSSTVFFAIEEALSQSAENAHKKDWKDVVQWREHQRGDLLLALPLASAVTALTTILDAHTDPKPPEDKPAYPTGSRIITHSPFAISELVLSHAGDQIAFETGPIAHRLEDPSDTETFVAPTSGGDARQLTHNEGLEGRLAWNPAGSHIFVLVRASGGSIEGPYKDVQGRIYSLDAATGQPTRLGSKFEGSWEDLTVADDGKVFAVGLRGVNQSLYRINGDVAELVADTPGTFGHISIAEHGGAVLFTHSAISNPAQVFLASDALHLRHPRPSPASIPSSISVLSPSGSPSAGSLTMAPTSKACSSTRPAKRARSTSAC